ncbi:MAG: hypothetical protein Q8Q28_03410 [Pseudomonadota bacterium]|nr:hypothetical protein [Pseudomonadota bacterium]
MRMSSVERRTAYGRILRELRDVGAITITAHQLTAEEAADIVRDDPTSRARRGHLRGHDWLIHHPDEWAIEHSLSPGDQAGGRSASGPDRKQVYRISVIPRCGKPTPKGLLSQGAAISRSSSSRLDAAAAAPAEIPSPPPPPPAAAPAASAAGKRRRMRPSGVITWTPDDESEAARIEASHAPDDIAAAVAAIKAAGRQPVPGLVSGEIERVVARREAADRHARQIAASRAQVDETARGADRPRSRPPAGWAGGI